MTATHTFAKRKEVTQEDSIRWTPVLGLETDTAPAAATFDECVILIAKGLDGHIYMNVMADPYSNDFCGF